MVDGIRALLVIHFIGLTMGFAAGWGNMVMAGLMARSTPDEQKALSKFPPLIVRVADIGLVLLWVSGLSLVFVKWDGFGNVPGLFHAKLTSVVLMTLVIGYSHSLAKKMAAGDAAALARGRVVGQIIFLLAVITVVLAVWSFN